MTMQTIKQNSSRSTFLDIPAFGVRFAALSMVVMLAACGTFNAHKGASKPQLVAEPDGPTLMLADAADRATRALETLAAVEQSRTPSAQTAAIVPNAPPELQKAVSFSWAGPVEPVARDMAGRAGYQFRTVGNAPVTPIVVTISAYNTPIVEVLRDIGLQMGTRADLRVDANTRLVEIVYRDTVNAETPNSSTPRRRR